MKVYNTAPFNQDIIHVQESVIIHQNKLFFRCKDGWLELLKIQPAGKAVMTARDFINGQKNK
jgi:methionyl-tRNA formyltransferase